MKCGSDFRLTNLRNTVAGDSGGVEPPSVTAYTTGFARQLASQLSTICRTHSCPVGTKTADDILGSVERFYLRTSGTGH
jgi:hypothetical protein